MEQVVRLRASAHQEFAVLIIYVEAKMDIAVVLLRGNVSQHFAVQIIIAQINRWDLIAPPLGIVLQLIAADIQAYVQTEQQEQTVVLQIISVHQVIAIRALTYANYFLTGTHVLLRGSAIPASAVLIITAQTNQSGLPAELEAIAIQLTAIPFLTLANCSR